MPKKKDKIRELLYLRDFLLGEKVALDVWEDLKITEDPELQMQDCLYNYQLTGMLEAAAEAKVDIQKVDLDNMFAELDDYARNMEVMARPTDAKVKCWIQRDKKYIEKRKEIIDAKMKYLFWKHINRALVMKADFIRSKVASRRAELVMPAASVETIQRKKKKKKKKKLEE